MTWGRRVRMRAARARVQSWGSAAAAVVGIGGGERSGAGRGACHPGVLPAARPAQELGRADPEVAAGPGELAGAEPAELLGRRAGAGCGPASVPGHGRGIDVGID